MKKKRQQLCFRFQNISTPPLIAPELYRMKPRGQREDIATKNRLYAHVPQNKDKVNTLYKSLQLLLQL